jgi:sulfite reductase (ferredoxin)
MTCGELLEILLDDGEPIENVPQSLAAEGHTVEGIEKLGDGGFIVFVRKL